MDIGEKIKNLRHRMGLTQEELAERADLTKGFISQLEHDTTSPSVDTLESLVQALGITMYDFFREEKEQSIVFHHNDTKQTNNEEFNHIMHWIIPDAQKNTMEPILIELNPSGVSKQYSPFEGEVFGYVLTGEITLYLGDRKYTVKSKDSFYFDAKEPFWIENKKSKLAKLMWVVTPPIF